MSRTPLQRGHPIGDCDVHARHNSIRDAVRDAAVYGHLNPSVETRILLGSRRRPANVFLPNFGNAGLYIDVTLVNGFMHAQKNRTFVVLTEALNTAANRKRDTYEGVALTPLVTSTLPSL